MIGHCWLPILVVLSLRSLADLVPGHVTRSLTVKLMELLLLFYCQINNKIVGKKKTLARGAGEGLRLDN